MAGGGGGGGGLAGKGQLFIPQLLAGQNVQEPGYLQWARAEVGELGKINPRCMETQPRKSKKGANEKERKEARKGSSGRDI